MNQQEINILKAELKQFTGSDNFYRNKGYVQTEGVTHLAEQAQAYWLIDYILSYQLDPKLRVQPFSGLENDGAEQ